VADVTASRCSLELNQLSRTCCRHRHRPAGQAETIFQTAILEQGRGRVLDTLAEIQERNRAVKDLEASLLELHQIFLDMAVLVEAQGEMLDNIEQQVRVCCCVCCRVC
jgi:hypothetical protein